MNRFVPFLLLATGLLSGGFAQDAPPAGTGKILYQFWSGIDEGFLARLKGDPRFPGAPSGFQELTEFASPTERDDHYGARIAGWIHPPATGDYTFYLASDDQGELSLSSDAEPVNAVRIASVPEWTDPQEWAKFPEQTSKSIRLEAGKRYYIEALVTEGEGGDHLAAGWKLPDGTMERPIPGKRLSPWKKPELPPDAAGGIGKILYETYAAIEGSALTDLVGSADFPAKPSATKTLERFDAPVDHDDSYGARIRGFLHAPQSGAYVFWISSDDQGELLLSPDEDPKKAVAIAGVPEWTGHCEWDKFPEQRSKPVPLEAGKKYYVEARMKEGGGGDNLSVGWAVPGGRIERPIPGKWLSPPGP
jgi:hypothetical protein